VKDDPKKHDTPAELLADWRSAERDTVAARDAARIAALALTAAEAAEVAATEVQAAATEVEAAVERARSAATRARKAASDAADAAKTALTSAQGDKVRANHSVAEAVEAEGSARDRFHEAEAAAYHRDD
jgi:hypothetical protein